VRRDEEQATALAGRDEDAARAADERVAELEAEAAEARRQLRAARAEAEAMRRDLERERERVEAAEAAVRRGRITELDGEPVEADPDQRPTTVAAPDGDEALAAARAEADDRAEGEDGTRADLDDETEIFERPRGEEATEVAERNGSEDETEMLERPPDEEATEVATLERPEPVAGDPGETVRVLGARRPRRTGEGTPADAAPGTAAIGARHIEPGQTPQRSSAAAWIARALAFAALAVVILALLLVVKPF
jgi:hypothetical protein